MIADDGRVELGVWEVTPGTFQGGCDGYYEDVDFVAGQGTITDADGVVHARSVGNVRHALPGRLVGTSGSA